MELVRILGDEANEKVYSQKLSKVINENLVPIKRSQVNKLVASYKKEEPDAKCLKKDWGETGREPMMEVTDVEAVISDLH